MTYLTRNEQALDIAQRAWTYQRNGQPKLVASARRMPEDAVEITLPTPDVEAEEIFALLLLMRLGHALY